MRQRGQIVQFLRYRWTVASSCAALCLWRFYDDEHVKAIHRVDVTAAQSCMCRRKVRLQTEAAAYELHSTLHRNKSSTRFTIFCHYSFYLIDYYPGIDMILVVYKSSSLQVDRYVHCLKFRFCNNNKLIISVKQKLYVLFGLTHFCLTVSS